MSHEIDETTGEAAIAYQSDTGVPWHGLGFPISRDITPKQMLKAAKLDWKVKMAGVQFTHEGKGHRHDADHQVMYREDTGMVLDITGKKYVPFQNDEVMNFFKQYVEEGEMTLETAGSLYGGQQIWALARMEKGFTLPGKDRTEGYVLLMNPHQYGKGGLLKFTPIRVVCKNTLSMAIPGGGIKLWHNRPFDDDMQDEAKRRLGIAREQLDSYKDAATKLSQWNLDEQQAINALNNSFQAKVDQPREAQPQTVGRIIDLWNGAGMGSSLKSAAGTAWGLLNAATEFLDHEYGKTVDSRMTNAWLGRGSTQKRDLMNDLLTMGQAA